MEICNKRIHSNSIKRKRKIDFLVFLLLYVSNDTLLFGTNESKIFSLIQYSILICLFLWVLVDPILRKSSRIMTQSMSMVVFLLCCLIIMTMLLNTDTSIKYFYQIFVILFSGLIVLRIGQREFINSFNKVMSIFAVSSTIMFAIAKIAYPLVQLLPSIKNESGYTYYFYGLGFVDGNSQNLLMRNYGIFREPGVFTIFLLMAIVFELFFTKSANIKRVAAYIIATVATFSTMGFIVVPLILATYIIRTIIQRKTRKGVKILLAFLFILFFIIFLIGITGNFEKIFLPVFNKIGVENASRDSRIYSILVNLDIMKESPILGKGWTFVEKNFERYGYKYSGLGVHNTNTFMKILSVYGILYCFLLIKQTYLFIRKQNNIIISLMLLVVFLLILSNEDMIVNSVVYIFAFYGFKIRRKIKMEN